MRIPFWIQELRARETRFAVYFAVEWNLMIVIYLPVQRDSWYRTIHNITFRIIS